MAVNMASLKEVQNCNDVPARVLPPSLVCSVCKNEMISASKIHEHPVLRKVGVCSECYDTVVNTHFTKDKDGHEDQCRWCGRGGAVLCCERCEKVFCEECIIRNFGHKKGLLPILEADNWTCYCCNSRPLRAHRNRYIAYRKAVAAGFGLEFFDRSKKSRDSYTTSEYTSNAIFDVSEKVQQMKQELSDTTEEALERKVQQMKREIWDMEEALKRKRQQMKQDVISMEEASKRKVQQVKELSDMEEALKRILAGM